MTWTNILSSVTAGVLIDSKKIDTTDGLCLALSLCTLLLNLYPN